MRAGRRARCGTTSTGSCSVIFDVEAVFLFPWARIFEGLGYQAVVEMAIFIGILAVGILYAWHKGVLKWA